MNPAIPARTTLAVGLVLEVVGSNGIAAAQYLDGTRLATGIQAVGLSWVAVWMMGFSVMIPSRPRRALLAAPASAASVPVIVATMIASARLPFKVDRADFFFTFVLPYLLVVLVAYVGARVVYTLGTELHRAQELGSYSLLERLGGRAAWAKCGGRDTGCWRAPRRSS